MPEHPESFPVNALVPIKGTPLEDNEVSRRSVCMRFIGAERCTQPVPYPTLLRTIATARIVLPQTIIRLAAGRQTLDESKQAMCFMAGANAIFTGEQMLTTPCASPKPFFCPSRRLSLRCDAGSPWDEDKAMMARWGLEGMHSFEQVSVARKEQSTTSSEAPEVNLSV